MPGFGVTAAGFEVKRLTTITDRIYEYLKDNINPNLDTSTGSVTNQLVEPFAYELEEVWEKLHEVFLSRSPNDAEGISLDHIMAYLGLRRLEAAPTRALIAIESDVGSPLTTAFQVLTDQNKILQLMEDFTTRKDNLQHAFYSIEYSGLAGETYTLEINSTVIAFTDTAPSGALNVTTNLKNLIESTVPEISASVPSNAPEYIYVIGADGQIVESVDSGFNTLWYNACWFEALIPEKYILNALNIDSIITAISGVRSANNPDPGVTGRDPETDSEARIRFKTSFSILGAGTLEAIVARMKNLEGVTNVIGYENRKDIVVDGREPHSIELIIEGGDQTAIGDLLWLIKGGGIELNGNTSVVVLDSNGDPQTVKFTRPEILFAYLKVQIVEDTETTFPANGDDQIIENILAEAAIIQKISLDLIGQRYVGAVHKVQGVRSVTITVDAKPVLGSPIYTTEKIITSNELALLDATRITIIR